MLHAAGFASWLGHRFSGWESFGPSLLWGAKNALRSSAVPLPSGLSLRTCRLRFKRSPDCLSVLRCTKDRPGGAAGLSGVGALMTRGAPARAVALALIREYRQEAMRPSEVPVLSLHQHDLVYDPGGRLECLPLVHARMLRSSAMKLSAVHSGTDQASVRCLSRTGPRLSNNFRGSIQTLLTCVTRLLTFISSSQRAPLLGWWLTFARGRILTSWIATTVFLEIADLESHSHGFNSSRHCLVSGRQ